MALCDSWHVDVFKECLCLEGMLITLLKKLVVMCVCQLYALACHRCPQAVCKLYAWFGYTVHTLGGSSTDVPLLTRLFHRDNSELP